MVTGITAYVKEEKLMAAIVERIGEPEENVDWIKRITVMKSGVDIELV